MEPGHGCHWRDSLNNVTYWPLGDCCIFSLASVNWVKSLPPGVSLRKKISPPLPLILSLSLIHEKEKRWQNPPLVGMSLTSLWRLNLSQTNLFLTVKIQMNSLGGTPFLLRRKSRKARSKHEAQCSDWNSRQLMKTTHWAALRIRELSNVESPCLISKYRCNLTIRTNFILFLIWFWSLC